jgi:hypothetical protein
LDAHEIAPGLWQGSFPPPGPAVAQGGFNLLVLCARELQPPSNQFHNVAVVHAPNDDNAAFGPLTREKLGVALQAARRSVKAIENGQRVLVTCAKGMNRSGLVSALTLHLLYGWPGEQCIQQVRSCRKGKDGYRPLSNSDFTGALRRLSGRVVPSRFASRPGGGTSAR